MKVLRSGIDLYVQECDCGCVFAYSKKETEYVQTGMNEYEHVIQCPECKARLYARFQTKERYEGGFRN